MGTSYEFICPSCDYKAEVSGKKDIGMACATMTIICEECKELYDIVISEEPWLVIKPGFKLDKKKIRCPVSEKHSCRIWKYENSCPQCGVKGCSGVGR